MEFLKEITENSKTKISFFLYECFYIVFSIPFIFLCTVLIEFFKNKLLSNTIYEDNGIYKINFELLSNRNLSLYKFFQVLESILPFLCILLFLALGLNKFYNEKIKSELDRLFIKANIVEEFSAYKYVRFNNSKLNIDSTEVEKNKFSSDILKEDVDKLIETINMHKSNNEKLWKDIDELNKINCIFDHEVRTPLSKISMQAQIIVKQLESNNIKMESFDIENIKKRLNSIINQSDFIESYLEKRNHLIRLEGNKISLSKISIGNLVEFIKDLVENYKLDLTKEIIFEENFEKIKIVDSNKGNSKDEKENFIEVDLYLLEEALRNIINNAIDFSYSKIIVSFKIETLLDDKYIIISIIDDGVGFNEDSIENYKKQFYSIRNKEASNGNLGLGLSISDKIIRDLNGEMILGNSKIGAKVQIKLKVKNKI